MKRKQNFNGYFLFLRGVKLRTLFPVSMPLPTSFDKGKILNAGGTYYIIIHFNHSVLISMVIFKILYPCIKYKLINMYTH